MYRQDKGRGLMRGARQIASVDKLRATKSDVLIIGVENQNLLGFYVHSDTNTIGME